MFWVWGNAVVVRQREGELGEIEWTLRTLYGLLDPTPNKNTIKSSSQWLQSAAA